MGGRILLVTVLVALAAGLVLSFVLLQRRRRRAARAARAPRALPPKALPAPTAAPDAGWRSHKVVQRWWLLQQVRSAHARRSLQRVSADLRRLRALLSVDHHDSAVHQFAHRMAYDQLLVEACAMLEVPHGLGPEVTGPDRELERFRAEANLQAAGVILLPPRRSVHD